MKMPTKFIVELDVGPGTQFYDIAEALAKFAEVLKFVSDAHSPFHTPESGEGGPVIGVAGGQVGRWGVS